MKRITFITIAALMMVLTGCKSAPDKHYLEALCKFIPDHGLKVEARQYLTEDYFNAYSEAFEAPTGSYGEIGEGEWLFYFVSGNGGGQPVFEVKDFQRDGDRIEADVEIVGDPDPHKAVFVKDGGQWKVADWDSTKTQCVEYIRDMRQKYADGTIERQMQQDSTLAPYLDDFKKELESFYSIYGK
jgi:hypothetical protein